jgi:4-hydroxybenzoate polyprenyltransferase
MEFEAGSADPDIKTAAPIPLFIDLDGTLVKSDLLIESFLQLLRQAPWCLLLAPLWLMSGIARLKAEVAKRVVLPIERLPLQEDFVAFLRETAREGRPIYLATASTRLLAELVAERIGFFSGVLASDEKTNLKGTRKLEAIREMSEGPFDYAGNARSDISVWAQARKGLVVNPGLGVYSAARRQCQIDTLFEDRPPTYQSWIRALRVYQWMKNLLLGVPVLTAHAFSVKNFSSLAVGFLAFGMIASSSYIINDMVDLSADRFHPRKRKRPLAAGDISLLAGLVGMSVSLVSGFFLAAMLPNPFLLSILAYLLLTIGYSLFFKTVVLLDVILLGALYTVRIVAGGAAIGVEISFWLLAFSMFVFFSIALVKRSSELLTVKKMSETAAVGRDYRLSDYSALNAMGIASGYLSVLVLALYIDTPLVKENYTNPYRLWLLCPLMLYWISRLWIKTSRGEMHDDPLLYSLRDVVSWLVLFAMLLITLSAI